LFSVFVVIIAFAVALAQQPSRTIAKIEIEVARDYLLKKSLPPVD